MNSCGQKYGSGGNNMVIFVIIKWKVNSKMLYKLLKGYSPTDLSNARRSSRIEHLEIWHECHQLHEWGEIRQDSFSNCESAKCTA